MIGLMDCLGQLDKLCTYSKEFEIQLIHQVLLVVAFHNMHNDTWTWIY